SAAGRGRAWNGAGAVIRLEGRCRAPGRVVAGVLLHFENDDLAILSKVGADGGAGDASADNENVGFNSHAAAAYQAALQLSIRHAKLRALRKRKSLSCPT